MNSVIKERIASTRASVAETLRKGKVPFTSIVAGKDNVTVTVADPAQSPRARPC